jgi:prepilin-type N-terminal cleavage/methylation domain-containing protein
MRKAFTLIELLVVIAIIAILAAILFPVFAQAKKAAKVTASISGLKQMALGLQMYSNDFDDMAVFEYGYADGADTNYYHYTNTWVGRILPYVKNNAIFFDKTIPEISDFNKIYQDPYYTDPFYSYTWAWMTSFSINTDGYSRSFGGFSCDGTVNGGDGGPRSLTAISAPADRLAVAPTRYGAISNWAWFRFQGVLASWPTADEYADTFSWYQQIYDDRRQYDTRFIGAFADGHAAKYGPEKFVKYYANDPSRTEANTWDEYCTQMNNRKLWDFWGRYWVSD